VTIPKKYRKRWNTHRENSIMRRRFAAEGRKIGVDVTNNVDARHWKRLRAAFLRCVAERISLVV
jgi:hypothetical protein